LDGWFSVGPGLKEAEVDEEADGPRWQLADHWMAKV